MTSPSDEFRLDGICENCRYWKRVRHGLRGDFGECHRYAPRPFPTPESESDLCVSWPYTDREDYCYDWRTREI